MTSWLSISCNHSPGRTPSKGFPYHRQIIFSEFFRTTAREHDSHWYLVRSSAVRLSAARRGSCRWRPVPSGSALWCLQLPEWRPALWSSLPFDQLVGLIKYLSSSSSSPPEYSEQMPRLQHGGVWVTFYRQKRAGNNDMALSCHQMGSTELHAILQQEI